MVRRIGDRLTALPNKHYNGQCDVTETEGTKNIWKRDLEEKCGQ